MHRCGDAIPKDTATRALQALRQAGAQRGSRRERRAGRDRIRQLLPTYTGHTYVPGSLGLKTGFSEERVEQPIFRASGIHCEEMLESLLNGLLFSFPHSAWTG